MKSFALLSETVFTVQRFSLYPFVATLLIVALFTTDLHAQRITYESLRMRDRQPNVFVDHLVMPDFTSNELTLVTTFRLEHNFLSFRSYRGETSREQMRQFYAEPTVRISVRETIQRQGADQRQESRTNSGETIATRTWSEAVYTETFEQTQSSGLFVQNMIKTSLAPGRYHIETVMTADSRTRRDRVPGFKVSDADDSEIAYFYFLDDPSEVSPPYQAPLMNMGRNVYFGRDHQLAIWFPDTADDADYKLEIHQLRIQRGDTTEVNRVLEHSIDQEELLTGYHANFLMEDEQPHLKLQESDNADSRGAFYLLQIPNSTYENAHFRIRLTRTSAEGEETVLASRTYQSLWLDMPVSLYNLDVAINMMRFIVDDETLRSLRRGSRQEREKRFQEFWSQRDPSPDKEYNELMVEYFRRIDYAFEKFTTPQKPGYESDQGKIYITHGEPVRRERTFPPNQSARETWHYNSRTFVFEATTGFGDYRLVERK